LNIERERLLGNVPGPDGWHHWGPYLSERQWGTVREDYSAGGTAWEYFPHEHARSRAYRWGEDGIAGISDAEQQVCLSLALWNGADSILKERLFGLTNAEGNHGEDVKEHYFYLDATPTHSYLRMLYKYPQRAFPYADLVAENARRGTDLPEYELLDTGVFAEDRYFDVFVEYAQVGAGRYSDENYGMESRRCARGAAPDSAIGVAQYLDLGTRLGSARRSLSGGVDDSTGTCGVRQFYARSTSSRPTCGAAAGVGSARRLPALAQGPPPPPESRLQGRNVEWRTSTTPTSFPCPTSGNIRGMPPGIWRSTASRFALIDAGVRQAAARAADARMVHASQRPVARLRMGLRRCESARPCLGGVARLSNRPQSKTAATATSSFSNASSTS
jgi:hypothetical protein